MPICQCANVPMCRYTEVNQLSVNGHSRRVREGSLMTDTSLTDIPTHRYTDNQYTDTPPKEPVLI